MIAIKTKTFLITRPRDQAQGLANQIHALGYQTVLFPALALTPIKPKIDSAIDCYDHIIFISPAAVQFMKPWLPAKINAAIFTIGADTAAMVAQQGLGLATYPTLFNRQGLLALPALQALQQKKILLCQSQQANTEIATTLKQRGAQVTIAACYQTALPVPSHLPDLNKIGVIICTSLVSMENVLQLFGKKVRQKPWLVSSQKLYDYAKIQQISSPIKLAANASNAAILEAIQTY